MNKTDIMKAAEGAAADEKDRKKLGTKPSEYYYDSDLTKHAAALIAAAELLKQVEVIARDMAVAHDMSHAPMCDEGYWKGEFREKFNQLTSLFGKPVMIDKEGV